MKIQKTAGGTGFGKLKKKKVVKIREECFHDRAKWTMLLCMKQCKGK